MRTIVIVTTCLLSCLLYMKGQAQISFVETTDAANLDYFGESWGAAWGDVNADGRPDLFVGNHKRSGHVESDDPAIYVNTGGGIFGKRYLNEGNDVHGAAWMDIDNNGLQDLILTTGRSQRDVIVYNRTDSFSFDVSTFSDKIGVATGDLGRSRSIVPFDINKDGKLDIIIPRSLGLSPGQVGTALYLNVGARFEDVSDAAGFSLPESCNLIGMMDIDGDRDMEILASLKRRSIFAFANNSLPLARKKLLTDGTISDFMMGDLNGDLMTDLVVLYLKSISSMGKLDAATARAIVYVDENEEGFTFQASLPLRLDLRHGRAEVYDVYIGDTGSPKSYYNYQFDTVLTTYPHGTATHTGGVDKGVYIGYDSLTSLWRITYSDPNPTLGIAITAEALDGSSVTIVDPIGFDPNPVIDRDRFMYNNGGGNFTTVSDLLSVPTNNGSRSGVIGDFDNDMDLDVYLMRGYGVPNPPNRLLENDGTGDFSIVPLAGGAEGTKEGLPDVVTVVDYNNDGFLDLFLTNGASNLTEGGPHQLFRNNTANGNKWLEIRLRGTVSNADGLGASVILYAGGKAQLREQHGGFHRFSQNHQRIHFGLASNAYADSLVIYWPSGIIQKLSGPIVANQKKLIVEPSGPLSRVAAKQLVVEGPLRAVPNPTTDQFTLEYDGAQPTNGQIRVVSIEGKLILNQPFTADFTASLKAFAPGIYQVFLFDNDGKVLATAPLVKQ